MDIISLRKRVADTDVVNDVTCTRQSVITRMVIRFLGHYVIQRITASSHDKLLISIIVLNIKQFGLTVH